MLTILLVSVVVITTVTAVAAAAAAVAGTALAPKTFLGQGWIQGVQEGFKKNRILNTHCKCLNYKNSNVWHESMGVLTGISNLPPSASKIRNLSGFFLRSFLRLMAISEKSEVAIGLSPPPKIFTKVLLDSIKVHFQTIGVFPIYPVDHDLISVPHQTNDPRFIDFHDFAV